MGLRLGELVERFGGRVLGDAERTVVRFMPPDKAGADDIVFVADPKRLAPALQGAAGVLIVKPAMAADVPASSSRSVWLHDDPYLMFARAGQALERAAQPPTLAAIDARAAVDATAVVPASCHVEPFASIGAGARLGERVQVGSGAAIGAGAVIGADSVIAARATLYPRTVVGARCIVHSGAVLGADGFGFAPSGDGWVKIPQQGRVVLGDDVEVGANTTIDRGALDDTVIEDGVKLDNQIQIGHNCRIGAHTAIAACVGIAGSTTIGKRCTIGGAAMFVGHIDVCDGTFISGGTLVGKSITQPGRYTGHYPMDSQRDWEKNAALVRHLAELRERIKTLERNA
ncbi:UDP-3-O-(3-hydroxymyristoyl)glucosamine N-acyltransferase [soil metagenome]